MTQDLYPEITKAGSFEKLLNKEFKKNHSSFTCTRNTGMNPFVFAHIKKDNRSASISTAANERLFLLSFWRDGVLMANARTPAINEMIRMLDYWLASHNSTKTLTDKFDLVEAYRWAAAFDEKREVEYSWQFILHNKQHAALKSFVELAINDPIVNKLFPFISLNRLRFSSCTGFPHKDLAPIVIPIAADVYEVRLHGDEVFGSGSAGEALAMVKLNLPKDIQPAVSGTGEQPEFPADGKWRILWKNIRNRFRF